MQAAQNKCIRFYLKVEERKSITVKEFEVEENINWLPMHERVNQCTLFCIYKSYAKKVPYFTGKSFSHVENKRIPTCYSYKKLKLPRHKTNQGLTALSYIGPSLWNNLDKSLKTPASLNTIKHNIKNYYFWKEIKKVIVIIILQQIIY